MKKSIIKNISLSIACLLGVGGVISAASFSKSVNQVEAVSAAEPVASESLNGAGTQESPYLISSASDLIKFRNIVNAGSYTSCAKLTSNITFTGENNWTKPIGNTYPHRYLGVFDGCGYTISGINFTKTNERLYYYGLFGCAGASTIKNVTMKNGSFTVDSMYLGAIVGNIDTSSSTLIENCHNVSFDLNFVDATNNGSWVGGIVGSTASDNTSCNITIRNCGSTGNVTSNGDDNYCDAIGGIVGFEFSKAGNNISNCYNAGTVHNTSNTDEHYPKVGGIIGWSRRLFSLRNCHNYGSVISDKAGNNNVGGAIGYLEKLDNIVASFSSNYYLNTVCSRPIGTYDSSYNTATFPKALTADQFKNPDNFTGWNFTDLWRMGNLYPELGGEPVQASATGYQGAYDGQPHSISVTVTEPTEGYTITYSTSSTGEYTSVNPTYTDVGTYTTYYKVSADEYVDATGSETVIITKADPSYVVPSVIDAPYNVELSTIGLPEGFTWMDASQKTSTWGENTFKAKYTPSDTVNYNVVENIDIKVNVKWILVDPTEGDVSVTIKDGETEYNVDISVKVEVKTEVTVDEKRAEYASIGREFIKQDEDINAIYSVKLIKTVGGVQTEIQPSDIKEGTKIFVAMPVPEELVGNPFRLLEIFSATEAKEMENYALTQDGKTVVVEVDRMGEFAFIGHTDQPNGFDYPTGIPAVAVVFIVLGVILLVLAGAWALMMFVFNKWIRREGNAIRAFKLFNIKKDDKFLVVSFPVKFEYKLDNEIFNTKEEALK